MSETPNRISAEVAAFNARESATMRARIAELEAEGDPTMNSDCDFTETNPRCPDSSSHSMNAFDQLYPTGRTELGHRCFELNEEELAAVTAVATAEYLDCEGHGDES